MSKELTWPAWFSGPKGETAVFEAPEDVPNGWTSGAEAQSAGKKAKAPAAPPASPPSTPAPKQPAAAGGDDLDADGHPYDPSLHAATKSKTKEGKWRMKVGVKRPDPAPGFPKPPLDL